MTSRGAKVLSGGRTRRDVGAALLAAEFRLIEARDEAAELRRALIRLRATARAHLEHPTGASCAALRHELGRRPEILPEKGAAA